MLVQILMLRTDNGTEFKNEKLRSLCYPTKNHDDLGKIKPKVDIECYEVRPPKVSNNSAAKILNDEDTPSSSLIIVKDHKAPQLVSSSEEPISSKPTTPVSNNNTDESIQEYDPSNMHEFYQQYFSIDRWAKNHPIEQVLGDPSKHAMTRSRLHSYVKMCMYALIVSTIKPTNIKEAMLDHNWIESI
nr:hypothetical protein [Tanacetum cinerariifolium]